MTPSGVGPSYIDFAAQKCHNQPKLAWLALPLRGRNYSCTIKWDRDVDSMNRCQIWRNFKAQKHIGSILALCLSYSGNMPRTEIVAYLPQWLAGKASKEQCFKQSSLLGVAIIKGWSPADLINLSSHRKCVMRMWDFELLCRGGEEEESLCSHSHFLATRLYWLSKFAFRLTFHIGLTLPTCIAITIQVWLMFKNKHIHVEIYLWIGHCNELIRNSNSEQNPNTHPTSRTQKNGKRWNIVLNLNTNPRNGKSKLTLSTDAHQNQTISISLQPDLCLHCQQDIMKFVTFHMTCADLHNEFLWRVICTAKHPCVSKNTPQKTPKAVILYVSWNPEPQRLQPSQIWNGGHRNMIQNKI